MRNLYRANNFPGICNICGQPLAENEGILMAKKGNAITFERDKRPEWVVQCKKGKHKK